MNFLRSLQSLVFLFFFFLECSLFQRRILKTIYIYFFLVEPNFSDISEKFYSLFYSFIILYSYSSPNFIFNFFAYKFMSPLYKLGTGFCFQNSPVNLSSVRLNYIVSLMLEFLVLRMLYKYSRNVSKHSSFMQKYSLIILDDLKAIGKHSLMIQK